MAPLFERLFAVLERLDESFEVIAVDDGSTDATYEKIKAAARERAELRVVGLARTHGQHAAIVAGFERARGEWLISLDADLQNPPEEIPRLVEALRAGHDLVHTYRRKRHDPLARRLASRLANALVRRASGIPLRDFGCMLRGYHHDLIGPIVSRQEFHTFIPALASLYARHPIEIPVEHAPRAHGRSAYSFGRLLSLQLDLIASFSLAPLRILLLAGTCAASFGIFLGALLLVMRILLGPEWAAQGVITLFALLFLLVGAQFVALGVLGEYIGRVYQEVRPRPRYTLRASSPDERVWPNGDGGRLPGGDASEARDEDETFTG